MTLHMMAFRLASVRAVPRWANESDLEELGMSADYGPDQESMSTHTELEEEDLETTDTRTSLERQDGDGPESGSAGGGPCSCEPSCRCGPGCLGKGGCPNCGGDLVKLEGY